MAHIYVHKRCTGEKMVSFGGNNGNPFVGKFPDMSCGGYSRDAISDDDDVFHCLKVSRVEEILNLSIFFWDGRVDGVNFELPLIENLKSDVEFQYLKEIAMDLDKDWDRIRKHFNKSFSSNFYVSVASVDAENNPTVTPIGSMFLNDNQTEFYFEKFPSILPQHAAQNPNVCLLAVNSGRLFWIKAMFKGSFAGYPAIKLYGKLGVKRKASEKEIARLNR